MARVEWKGEERSLREWSDLLLIPYGTLLSRKKRGKAGDELFARPKQKKGRLYLANGRYATVREHAESVGLEPQALKRRLLRGMPFDAAIAVPAQQYDSAIHTVFGVKGRLADIARHFGVLDYTLREKVARGWRVDLAVSSLLDVPAPFSGPMCDSPAREAEKLDRYRRGDRRPPRGKSRQGR